MPGSAAPGIVTQPGLGLSGFQSGELQFAEQAAELQAAAGNPPGAVTRQVVEQARASASANNSPQPAKPQAVEAIKEHFEAARDEYAHSLFNGIMKTRISTLDKPEAKAAGHLFYDALNGNGDTVTNPFDPDKATWVSAKLERAAHADRVHRMVVHTFTEFLNMMNIEKASKAKHGGESVRWRPEPYSHAEAVREIRAAIAAGGGGSAAIPFKDGRLPSHTEADNAHYGSYGVVQRRAEYFQLLGLDSMHIMLVKALESRLATVLKRVAQTPRLKTTVAKQASEVHAAVPGKCPGTGHAYNDNIDKMTDPPDHGRRRRASQLHLRGTRYGSFARA